jgi:hypothetical protein
VSVLLASTLAVLRHAKPLPPLFSNMILAELFDAEHTRGSLRVLPRTTGGYVVFDEQAPLGAGVLEEGFATIGQAHQALERLAAARKAAVGAPPAP